MTVDRARPALQLRSLVTAEGELELSLVETEIPEPGENEVLIRVEAAPINPSDMGILFGPADLDTLKEEGTPDRPRLRARIPEALRRAVAARVGQPIPAGNEGAGTVVATGSSAEAKALLGKKVAARAGAMYGQYRAVHVANTLTLPEGATAAQGASAFINPLTVLGMVETMRREGHTAIVHTAAASALGQMLERVAQADGIPLVNVVRREEQVKILQGLGAKHVLSTASASFTNDLVEALAATKATLGFDATGGGKLASQLLSAMEVAINRGVTAYNVYGSSTHKQVYIYGALDLTPTELRRDFGFAWGLGGWLLPTFLKAIGPADEARLKARVAKEITTTFATEYAKEIALADVLRVDVVRDFVKRATGSKVLVVPNR